jgi:hypothetical protein
MALDPRTFLTPNCARSIGDSIRNAEQKKGFFDALEKIGNLEGLGDIGRGLRTLSGISNSARQGSVLGTVWNNIETATNEVLDTVGVGRMAAEFAKDFNPGVVNRGIGQARQIADKVRNGDFGFDDIPSVFQDVQNLEQLIKGIYTPNSGDNGRRSLQCYASPYAMDLLRYAPKYKFLFVVQFDFTPLHNSLTTFGDGMAFVVKGSTRPHVQFEYEDVNMYNFRTKVAKKTIYEPMTMRFIDDDRNNSMIFYNEYLRRMSPIANMRFDQRIEDSPMYEEVSMDYVNRSQTKNFYSSSLGPQPDGETKNILKRITLFHVYQQGNFMNVYKFYNPKILNMELNDLDMAESGEGGEMQLEFAYDGVHVDTDYFRGNTSEYNLEQLTNRGLYPLRNPRTNATQGTLSEGNNNPFNTGEGGGIFGDLEIPGPLGNAVTGIVGGASEIAAPINNAFNQAKALRNYANDVANTARGFFS